MRKQQFEAGLLAAADAAQQVRQHEPGPSLLPCTQVSASTNSAADDSQHHRSLQVLSELCEHVQQHAAACRAGVRHTVDFNDRSGVEQPVYGKAPRPMVQIKAEKLERARCAA